LREGSKQRCDECRLDTGHPHGEELYLAMMAGPRWRGGVWTRRLEDKKVVVSR